MITYFHIKRVMDVSVSSVAILVLSPVMLLAMVLLYMENGRKGIFFFQERPGLHRRIFRIIKFKTMNDRCDASGNLLPDDKRMTKTGKFLRSTSIDELPQLINVVKGDMSLIGPRPLLPQYLPLYSACQSRRHDVKPGVTGWAQCHGRNAISWTQKFELDVWYVEHLCFTVDLKIILSTVKKVLCRDGISQQGQATMEPFNGYN